MLKILFAKIILSHIFPVLEFLNFWRSGRRVSYKQFLMKNTCMRPRGLVTFECFNSGYPLFANFRALSHLILR